MFSNSRPRRPRRGNNRSFGRRFGGKHKNMNIMSAIFGTATLVLLCASLVEPDWFELEGGRCCLKYLGLSMFFGKFGMDELYSIIPESSCEEEMSDIQLCMNGKSLMLIHVVITFSFFAITSSLFSFVLDVLAPRKKPCWKAMKRYAVGYIFCVLNVATTVGFTYWASEELFTIQSSHKQYPGSKAEVSFGTGVYMMTAAGGVAILATASNLMRQYPTEEEEQAEQLLEAMDEMEDDSMGASSNLGYEPDPPPAYQS